MGSLFMLAWAVAYQQEELKSAVSEMNAAKVSLNQQLIETVRAGRTLGVVPACNV